MAVDLTGSVIGKLTLVERLPGYRKDPRPRTFYRCSCECGQEVCVAYSSLKHGVTRSCGCLQRKGGWKKRDDLKLKPGESNKNAVIRAYRTNAKRRGLSFRLSVKTMSRLFASNCFYCGTPPSNTARGRGRNGEFRYNGIDRIDNTKGYITKNVVPCCLTCNIMKGQMDFGELIVWICTVSKNFKKTKKTWQDHIANKIIKSFVTYPYILMDKKSRLGPLNRPNAELPWR